jgi:putative spermidine/putrescine transport system substrate-binding protein
MKLKSVFFIAILFITLFTFLYIMTSRMNTLSENSQKTDEAVYELGELSWEEIIEKGKEEGSVTFTTWWGDAFFNKVGELFEEKYGIRADVVIQDIETITHKIILEKERTTGTLDIYFAGFIGYVQAVLDADVLMSGLKKIPGWDSLMEMDRSYHKNLYVEDIMVPVYRNQVAFLYNPEYVSDPPRSWADFNTWIKKYPGKFVFSALKGGSGEAFKHSVLYKLTGGSDLYRRGARNPDPALISKWDTVWDWFNKNRDNYGLTASNHDSITRIQNGDAWITPAFVDDTHIAMKSGLLDSSMKLYMPDFGLFSGGDGAGIIANAPHKAAAMLFLSFLVSKEIQLLMLEEVGSDCIRSDIENPYNELLSEEERKKGINHTDAVYYLYLASEFQKNVLGK